MPSQRPLEQPSNGHTSISSWLVARRNKVKNKLNIMSMRWRILLLGTLIVVGMIISQIFYFFFVTVHYFEQEIDQENKSIAENIQYEIDTYIRQIIGELTNIYARADLLERIKNDELDYKDRNAAHEIILNTSLTSDNAAIYIYNNKDQLVSGYRKNSSYKYPFSSDIYDEPGNQATKQIIRKSSGRVLLLGYNDDKKENYIRIVLKLYQDGGKERIGYIVCDMNKSRLTRIAERYEFKDQQSMWLESSDGISTSLIRNDKDPSAEDKASETDYYTESSGSEYGYKVAFVYPAFYMEPQFQTLLASLIFMSIFIIVLWGSIIIISSKKMTNQLSSMIASLKKIEKGDMNVRIENIWDNEFGRIGKHINRMMDQIQKHIYEEYQLKMSLNEAKYYALQAQINPHFLFNTLGTMAGIAEVQDCGLVKNMCEALSDIFRYNIMGNIDKQFVRLAEEIDHIKNYMYIVNIRRGGDIHLDIHVEEQYLDRQIPKLSLQPLVENSVEHGLKNKRGEKFISISAWQDENYFYLETADNGTGFEEGAVLEYKKEEKHLSIGLKNIEDRIHYLYGHEYGLEVKNPNAGVMVSESCGSGQMDLSACPPGSLPAGIIGQDMTKVLMKLPVSAEERKNK